MPAETGEKQIAVCCISYHGHLHATSLQMLLLVGRLNGVIWLQPKEELLYNVAADNIVQLAYSLCDCVCLTD